MNRPKEGNKGEGGRNDTVCYRQWCERVWVRGVDEKKRERSKILMSGFGIGRRCRDASCIFFGRAYVGVRVVQCLS